MNTIELILLHPVATIFIILAIGWSISSIIKAFIGGKVEPFISFKWRDN